MKATTPITNLMARECTCGQMDQGMKATGKLELKKDKENGLALIAKSMKGLGAKIRLMGMGS